MYSIYGIPTRELIWSNEFYFSTSSEKIFMSAVDEDNDDQISHDGYEKTREH